MFARASVIVAVSLTLAACQTKQASNERVPVFTPIKISSSDIAAVQASVKYDLKDAPSAQFREIRAARSDNGKVAICGSVNSKNSYGGYVGFSPFLASMQDGKVEKVLVETTDNIFGIGKYCNQAGLSL